MTRYCFVTSKSLLYDFLSLKIEEMYAVFRIRTVLIFYGSGSGSEVEARDQYGSGYGSGSETNPEPGLQ
jgi:hypothetical protein